MKLQDYIQYYIGCNIKRISKSGEYEDEIILDPTEYYRINQETYPYSIKPILRKLEDMTNEECLEVHKISPFWADGTSEKYIMDRLYVIRERIIHLHLIPSVFHYLLKKGFDLFSLIENGLAIDSKIFK